MDMCRRFILVFIFVVLCPSFCWAGGAVARRQGMQKQVMQKKMQEQAMRARMNGAEVTRDVLVKRPAKVEDIVTLDQLLASLDVSSQAWELMIDQEAKEAVVSVYVDRFLQQGITISKPASFYVASIDGMVQNSKDALKQPFLQILQVVAIINYDFDNGQDPDVLAFKVFGSDEAVWENKKRLGIAH